MLESILGILTYEIKVYPLYARYQWFYDALHLENYQVLAYFPT